MSTFYKTEMMASCGDGFIFEEFYYPSEGRALHEVYVFKQTYGDTQTEITPVELEHWQVTKKFRLRKGNTRTNEFLRRKVERIDKQIAELELQRKELLATWQGDYVPDMVAV